jgi:hypothetical protein
MQWEDGLRPALKLLAAHLCLFDVLRSGECSAKMQIHPQDESCLTGLGGELLPVIVSRDHDVRSSLNGGHT